MKRLIIMVCIIVLSAFLAASSYAAVKPGQMSISPFIGWYQFDDDEVNIKDDLVYGLRLGYDITERWGAEGAFDYVSTDLKNTTLTGGVGAYGMRLEGLYHFLPQEKLVPFLAAGFGATMIAYPTGYKEDGNDLLFDYGAGVKYFLNEAWALRADIRNLLVFDGGRSDWEYTIGVTYLFGGEKPAVAPAAATAAAAAAAAAVVAGVAAADSDGDGVRDSLDKCPNTPKGVKVDQNGCPLVIDNDGDGVPDSRDKCPNTLAGVRIDQNGCPLDSDADRVADYLDKCPDTPKGTAVDRDGCPLPKKVSISLMIEFDTGKSNIKPQYDNEIKKVADFMNTYPQTTAVIEGHTDKVGKEASNVKLSTRRAESVKDYLVKKYGIAAGRLSVTGLGSSQPIGDNATPEGRQQNRRINAVIETTTK